MNNKMIKSHNYTMIKRNGHHFKDEGRLLSEHHLQILINAEYLIEVICTQEYLEELVLGRLLTEGAVRTEDEILDLEFDEGEKVVNITLENVSPHSMKCVKPIKLSDEEIFEMADKMAEGMPLHEATWGTHSCFLFHNGKFIFACEDLGRHNTLDKVIGYAIKHDIPLKECAVYFSGRVPADMAEKTIRAGIPVLVSKGVPTLEAVELALEYKLTLICSARKDQIKVYSDFRKKGIDALVLAGGKSRRMGGVHKGRLQIDEETFTEHVINEVKKVTDNVWISYGKDVHELYPDCQIVKDIYVNCGPIGGLHAGLKSAQSEYVCVLACDMPFLKSDLVEELQKHLTEEADAIVPRVDGRVHPLAAIYKKRVIPVLEEQISSGNYKMRSLLEYMKTIYVDLDPGYWGKILQNVNTMEEYKNIEKLRDS